MQSAAKVETTWIDEARRRYREYQDGLVEGIPGEGLFDSIRRELGWQS